MLIRYKQLLKNLKGCLFANLDQEGIESLPQTQISNPYL